MKTITALSCGLMLGGCGPNLYSVPFYTSTALHNGPALKFLKEGGPADVGGPDPTILVKDPYADGNMVALSASGGGMRASAFTLGVLAELDEVTGDGQSETAFQKIDLISSISGGSWAVAAVLADRALGSTEPLAKRMTEIESRYAELAGAKVDRWAGRFIPAVTLGLTYSQVYRRGASRPLPFAYFNSTLYPSHSPFVFTPAYLAHYKVKALGDPAEPRRILLRSYALADIPIGYAASASGAVPGFTSAFADTALCQDRLPSYCLPSLGKKVRDKLQLMDGGLYDNIGFKTALEVGLRDRDRIREIPATIIMIDSADVEDFQTMPDKGKDGGHIVGLAKAGSFPNQNATFDRLRGPGFAAAGFDRRILLDFATAAGFDPDLHRRHLDDLPELAYYAAHDVGCYGADGRFIPGRRRLKAPADPGDPGKNLDILKGKGADCVSLNFARTGYLHKTTFKYDRYAFRLRYQLGRLAVRMKRDSIAEALFRTTRTPPP
ncbi:MAG TPA: patatin-like phospholipase family protein [Allosphingosinicella sp.]|jgi:predicted acylesterase/phospholipase RssA